MFSYHKLWKLLIDKEMTKEDLRTVLKMSPVTMAKLGKGENVSLDVIGRICEHFGVQPGDIMQFTGQQAPTGEVGGERG